MMSELHSARRTDVSGEQPSDPGGADTDRPTAFSGEESTDRVGADTGRPPGTAGPGPTAGCSLYMYMM